MSACVSTAGASCARLARSTFACSTIARSPPLGPAFYPTPWCVEASSAQDKASMRFPSWDAPPIRLEPAHREEGGDVGCRRFDLHDNRLFDRLEPVQHTNGMAAHVPRSHDELLAPDRR